MTGRKGKQNPDKKIMDLFGLWDFLPETNPEEPNHPPALVEVADLCEGHRTDFTKFMSQIATKEESG